MAVGFQEQKSRRNQSERSDLPPEYRATQFEELTSWSCKLRQFKAAEETTELNSTCITISGLYGVYMVQFRCGGWSCRHVFNCRVSFLLQWLSYHFEILPKGRSDTHCKIKETLLIQELSVAKSFICISLNLLYAIVSQLLAGFWHYY